MSGSPASTEKQRGCAGGSRPRSRGAGVIGAVGTAILPPRQRDLMTDGGGIVSCKCSGQANVPRCTVDHATSHAVGHAVCDLP